MEPRYGFIHEKLEIKILILFLLRRLPRPVDMDTLTDLTMCDEGISFFDFADCVAELRESGHIEETPEGWCITKKGRENGEITEDSLPYSVRIRADRGAASVAREQQRDELVTTARELRARGGCTVRLNLSDGEGDVFSLELLCGSEEEAELMQKNFRRNAEALYSRITELLLADSGSSEA